MGASLVSVPVVMIRRTRTMHLPTWEALGDCNAGGHRIVTPIHRVARVPASSSSCAVILRAERTDRSSPDRQRGGDDPCVTRCQADSLEQSGRQARGRERQRDC